MRRARLPPAGLYEAAEKRSDRRMPAPDSEPPSPASVQTPSADTRNPSAPAPRPLLSEIAARLVQAVKGLRQDSTMRESLEEVLEESEREVRDLSSPERLMLANLLKFGELAVADVMVPRADIVAVEEKTPLPQLIAMFREAQHSRLPLYRDTLDEPLGMVHIKDVVTLVESGPDGVLRWPDTPIVKLKRDVLFVPGAMPALDLLLRMQATHKHMALVIDEYGGTDGLVTIENLMEEIVGDIDDEHDVEEEPEIVARGDGGFDADARADLDDFKTRTGIDLTREDSDEDVDTLGGIVIAALGRVPVRGEIVRHGGFEFEILEADARRVKRVRVRAAPSISFSGMR
jgi:CBS domain containing-hemolysin-like protein